MNMERSLQNPKRKRNKNKNRKKFKKKIVYKENDARNFLAEKRFRKMQFTAGGENAGEQNFFQKTVFNEPAAEIPFGFQREIVQSPTAATEDFYPNEPNNDNNNLNFGMPVNNEHFGGLEQIDWRSQLQEEMNENAKLVEKISNLQKDFQNLKRKERFEKENLQAEFTRKEKYFQDNIQTLNEEKEREIEKIKKDFEEQIQKVKLDHAKESFELSANIDAEKIHASTQPLIGEIKQKNKEIELLKCQLAIEKIVKIEADEKIIKSLNLELEIAKGKSEQLEIQLQKANAKREKENLKKIQLKKLCEEYFQNSESSSDNDD